MDAWGRLLALAAEQHGAVMATQAIDLGLHPSTLTRRLSSEGWVHRWRNVWSPPGTPEAPLTMLSAALLAAGSRALVTGSAGLWLHGVVASAPNELRIVAPMASHVVRHLTNVKVIASRSLARDDATFRRRLACATVERCLIDACIPPSLPVEDLRGLLIDCVQQRRTTVQAVATRARRARGVPGIAALHRVINDVSSVGADSPFTWRVHQRLLRTGLRPDAHPVEVATPGRTLHPDITFLAQRVCIECDGMLAHSRQQDLAIDHRKDRAYAQAGWVCLRIGWWEFAKGWAGFLDDLGKALAR